MMLYSAIIGSATSKVLNMGLRGIVRGPGIFCKVVFRLAFVIGIHGELGFFVMIMRGGGCFCCSFCL